MDLFIPVDSIEEEATLTCDAKGMPPPQYRYEHSSMKVCGNNQMLTVLLEDFQECI